MKSVFSYDAQTGPQFVDLNGIAAGYGVISVPVEGFLPGDQVQTVGLTITGTGLATIQLAVDMVQRTAGFYEWTDQKSIDAHFTITSAQIAAIAAATNCEYTMVIMVLRNGVQQTREVQTGGVSARPMVPAPPLIVNSITMTGGPVSGIVGAQAQLSATAYDGFGNALPSATVAWSSSNINVASVDATGRVTFLLPGTATITASSQGVIASTTGTCTDGSFLSPTDKQVNGYSNAQSKWLPSTLTAAFLSITAGSLVVGGGWPAGASELAPGAAGRYVRSNGAAWVSAAILAADVSDLATAATGITSVGVVAAGTWQANQIADAYLGTIATAGKVANSATTATSINTANAIIARDASGNFSAGQFTAAGKITAPQIQVTGTVNVQAIVEIVGTTTAVNGSARGLFTHPTIIASANGDTLTPQRIDWNLSTGAFTGVIPRGLIIGWLDTTPMVNPGDPALLDLGQINGAGATNAMGIFIDVIYGATNNYAILTDGGAIKHGGTTTVTTAMGNAALAIGGTIIASSGAAYSSRSNAIMQAAANNDVLAGYGVSSSYTPGAFTGVSVKGFLVSSLSLAGFTSPGDPMMIQTGTLTATGATNGYALNLGAVAGAVNNYAIQTNGGMVKIGGSFTATTAAGNGAVNITPSVTASGGAARALYVAATLIAAANNDELSASRVSPTFTPGVFTGVTPRGILVSAISTAGFTTPGNPAGIELSGVTGTGATTAYGVNIGNVSGATNSYAIATNGGMVSIGGTFTVGAGGSSAAVSIAGTLTAASGAARAVYIGSTFVAAANGDQLTALRATPSYTPGAFTGVIARGFLVSSISTAAFTSPGDPAGIELTGVTGTGANNAYGINLGAVTGAVNNYAVATNGGMVKIGGTFTVGAGAGSAALQVGPSITAGSGAARGLYVNPTLIAAANGDELTAHRVSPTFTPGAFTGLTARGLLISSISTATFTSPADPSGIQLTGVSGTGANNAYGLNVGSVTGAISNFAIFTNAGIVHFGDQVQAAGGLAFTGPATLGATAVGVFSLESPNVRYYIGDGSGYALRLSRRVLSATTDLFTFTDTGNFQLTGALQLGNAYTAGAPAATGYVTLKDSTGTTYKVLVST